MSSLVVTPNCNEERRRSVLPTNTPSSLRPHSSAFEPDSSSLDGSVGSSLLRSASFAANNFRRMSRVFRDEGPTKGFLRAAIGDPNRPKYMQLAMENDELYAEWKRLKGFAQNFGEEYKESKEAMMLDPYRRYKRLCAMVKKLVLHLRLNDSAPLSGAVGGRGSGPKHGPSFSGGQVLQSYVKEREMRQKHTNVCDSLTTEQLARETEKLREKNSELQSRIDLLIDGINKLSTAYEMCKRSPLFLRYFHLKVAAKVFIESTCLDN
ncbi:hypothetical protein ECG_08749 [Echinococcus granulosus]|uniref:Uncharacterized protein n=1 Tax=Echinococcus granulosus TaxID=6210 RepID=A0A068WZJ7_ECHGR|nr:hypothetical protein ECG_08749 [Echinococcus granulosus]CDS23916.1 hypothetical protein EgrG_000043700 [Echinococcus granulosus]